MEEEDVHTHTAKRSFQGVEGVYVGTKGAQR